MNLKSVLASVGVNLDDVQKHAEKIIKEARAELDLLHKKIDAQSEALILIDAKLERILNGNAGSDNNCRENGNDNRNSASGNGVSA